jgi:hypothetical protein
MSWAPKEADRYTWLDREQYVKPIIGQPVLITRDREWILFFNRLLTAQETEYVVALLLTRELVGEVLFRLMGLGWLDDERE